MEIKLADEKILLLDDVITAKEAEEIAWAQKTNAFGTFHQVSSFLSRPKDTDFTLTYTEQRYVPFFHLKGTSKYVYDRTITHAWPTSGPEVVQIDIEGKAHVASDGTIKATVIEHCKEEAEEERFVDGSTGDIKPDLSEYLAFHAKSLEKSDLEKLASKYVVVPPQARPSSMVREMATQIMRQIDADVILEEDVSFDTISTYYHPLFAFKYHWESKNKDSVVLVDGLTKQVTFAQEGFKQLMGSVFDYDFLFDISKDAAATLIPGGNIAVKIAQRYMDSTKGKKK